MQKYIPLVLALLLSFAGTSQKLQDVSGYGQKVQRVEVLMNFKVPVTATYTRYTVSTSPGDVQMFISGDTSFLMYYNGSNWRKPIDSTYARNDSLFVRYSGLESFVTRTAPVGLSDSLLNKANTNGSNAYGSWPINAATVTNGVYTSGSYSNPSWITSLAWSKITGAPAFLTSEADPVYSASSWFSTTNNATNWNTAFGWGNHASAGYELQSNKGANNGYASLDAGGKVPYSQLPAALMIYKGTWNASTNSPTLVDGTGTSGWTYRVSTTGSQDLGSGTISFTAGDYIIYNGTTWEKSDGTDAVTSVNGQQGVVTLDYSHVGAYEDGSTVANSTLWNGYAIEAVVYSSGTIQLPVWNSTASKFQFSNSGEIVTWLGIPSTYIPYTGASTTVNLNQQEIRNVGAYYKRVTNTTGTIVSPSTEDGLVNRYQDNTGATGYEAGIYFQNSFQNNSDHWVSIKSQVGAGLVEAVNFRDGNATFNGIVDVQGTSGFAIGAKVGRRRISSDGTGFSVLKDNDNYADFNAATATLAGSLYLTNTLTRISSNGSGGLDINYNNSSPGYLSFFGGGPSSVFWVTNTGNIYGKQSLTVNTNGTNSSEIYLHDQDNDVFTIYNNTSGFGIYNGDLGGTALLVNKANNNITLGASLTIPSDLSANNVVSTTNVTVGNGSAYNFGSLNTRIIGETGASGYLRFDVNGGERARLSATGNYTVSGYILSGSFVRTGGGSGNYSTLSTTGLGFAQSSGSYSGDLNYTTLTDNRTWTLPNASGVFALSVNGQTANPSGNITLNEYQVTKSITLRNSAETTYTVASSDYYIRLYSAPLAPGVLTLPAASSHTGRTLIIEYTGGGSGWSFNTAVRRQDGTTTTVVDTDAVMMLISDGTTWTVINSYSSNI